MRHEYLSVYTLSNDTINSNTINVDQINVGGGGLVTKTWNFATQGHVCGSHAMFNITGDVRIKLMAVCTTLLAGGGAGAQVSLGYNGALTALIADTTATQIDAGEIWVSSVNAAIAGYKNTSLLLDQVVTGHTSIKMNISSASTSTGGLTFYCWWEPITSGAAVTAAA